MIERADQAEGPHPQFAHIERLFHKLIVPVSEAAGQGFVRHVRRQNQDRRAAHLGLPAKLAKYIKTVDVAHREIENHQVVGSFFEGSIASAPLATDSMGIRKGRIASSTRGAMSGSSSTTRTGEMDSGVSHQTGDLFACSEISGASASRQVEAYVSMRTYRSIVKKSLWFSPKVFSQSLRSLSRRETQR